MQVLSLPTGFDSLHCGPRIVAPRLLCTAADAFIPAHPSALCSIRHGMGATYDDPATEALNGRAARYVAVAGLTVLLYDHVITMKEEVRSHLFL